MSSGQPSRVLKTAAPTTPVELRKPSTWMRSVHPEAGGLLCEPEYPQAIELANIKAMICVDFIFRLDEFADDSTHNNAASEKETAEGQFLF